MDKIQPVNKPSTDDINAALGVNLASLTRWSTPVLAACTAAGGAVVVSHDLNAVPTEISVMPYMHCAWWVDDDDRRMWTKVSITFHSSVAGRFTVKTGVR